MKLLLKKQKYHVLFGSRFQCLFLWVTLKCLLL